MQSDAVCAKEIGWRELVAEILRAKWLIAILVILGGVSGIVTAVVRAKWYEARVVVIPADDSGGGLGALGGLASQFSGLASIAGLALGEGGKSAEVIAVLQSELMTSRFIEKNDLLPVLFSDKWDAASQKWKEDDADKIPTLWGGNRYFARKVRDVSQDAKTGLVTLTIRWKDPKQAALWANELVAQTNEYLRAKALAESERSVEYLTAQAEQARVVEARRAMNSLLEQEINKAMIAQGREEYALRVVDPAVAPEKSANAGKVTLGALFGVLGGILALAFVFVRVIVRSM